MEIFDVIDKEGNPTGETVTRERAHTRGNFTPNRTHMDSSRKRRPHTGFITETIKE